MFETGFPSALLHDVQTVCDAIGQKAYIKIRQSEKLICYSLLNGENISFPYRVYCLEGIDLQEKFSDDQKLIYHCIFSRSCDGFEREKHIKAILSANAPSWTMPYVLKLSDEYVVEIIEAIYEMLHNKSTEEIQAVAAHNLQMFLYGHDRMISYWNEFYRDRYPEYKSYVGRALFHDCFGYSRSLERLRTSGRPF